MGYIRFVKRAWDVVRGGVEVIAFSQPARLALEGLECFRKRGAARKPSPRLIRRRRAEDLVV